MKAWLFRQEMEDVFSLAAAFFLMAGIMLSIWSSTYLVEFSYLVAEDAPDYWTPAAANVVFVAVVILVCSIAIFGKDEVSPEHSIKSAAVFALLVGIFIGAMSPGRRFEGWLGVLLLGIGYLCNEGRIKERAEKKA